MPYLRNRSSLSDFTDADQCSTIPIGDPYRKPGNYCATPDGGLTTFNADGSTYRSPGGADPDPAHPAGGGSGSGSGIGKILSAIFPLSTPATGPAYPPPSSGLSTTTALMIGGAALLVVLVATRKH